MIKPDFTKKDFIPEGVEVETIPTNELKPGDKVVKLGEIFIVVFNYFDTQKECYSIELKHETDNDTFIREFYIVPKSYTKTERRKK